MDILKFNRRIILISSILLLLISCAKVSYLFNQGIGQFKIQNHAIKNEDLLKDQKISEDTKNKIREITKYKEYFFKYFKKEKTSIYTETTLLKRRAVSYLVLASQYDKIEAKEDCFPFVGCFPYLGFFSEKEALEYSKQLEKGDYVTWVRPVYAYSTLGKLQDPILSSFFVYKTRDLANLVFHEIFHSVFFVKDEVELNENLANYFAKEMVVEYFKMRPAEVDRIKKDKIRSQEISKEVVKLVNDLQKKYLSLGNLKRLEKKQAKDVLDSFLQKTFFPKVKKRCAKLNVTLDNCFPMHKKWNNASFAEFLTYEAQADNIDVLRKQLPLKEFFIHIQNKYKQFKKDDLDFKTFKDYLFFEK